MTSDKLIQEAAALWEGRRYYQAIVLLNDDASQANALPTIDDRIFADIQSAATLEAAWLDHLLSGSDRYESEEVLLILMKRQNLETVVSALHRLDLSLDLSLDEIDQSIRNRFASRRMEPVSRRIYHNLYLAGKPG